MSKTVVIYGEVDPALGEIDALLYLKAKGEHALAVKVAGYRKKLIRKDEFFEELFAVVEMYDDMLIDKMPEGVR